MISPRETAPPAHAQNAVRSPRIRVDAMALRVRRTTTTGTRMEIRPPRPVTAAHDVILPMFEGWITTGELHLTATGECDAPFSAALDLGAAATGPSTTAPASVGEPSGEPTPRRAFSIELTTSLRSLALRAGAPLALGLRIGAGPRVVPLLSLTLVGLNGQGPRLASLDLLDTTDAVLFDAPSRRLFDLQNPEEGFWSGTGKWRLQLVADWAEDPAASYDLEARPAQILHGWQSGDGAGVIVEDTSRRSGRAPDKARPGALRTTAQFALDTSHPGIGAVPQEGKDIALDLTVEHTLSFGKEGKEHAVLAWHAPLPVRVRDPRTSLKAFQRLSGVGIDFGTTASVAALITKGYRSLLRLGGSSSGQDTAKSAENPAYLLIEDHERLWAEMDRVIVEGRRFPDLLRAVRGSHAAHAAMADAPSAVVGELKSLPERVIHLDQSPLLRDRERQKDFLLDEARVRTLIRTYAHLLGRAINRPGQDVYLHYWLTHPAKFDDRARSVLEEELKNGILLSIPEGIPAAEVTVEMSASEPEAFAAEVCPELAAHPALEPIIARFGELRFAVFDFGGGTLDIACGRFRPATDAEQEECGSATVIETLQVSGDDHLGGDYLTHEIVWLTHQDPGHLPEMEEREVPMMRPQTVPPNNLVSKPHLYKRSLAARQNKVRFERELALEQVKFGPSHGPKPAPALSAARLDGSEVVLESLGKDLSGLHTRLVEHLEMRIRDGVKLMKNMLAMTAWGGPEDAGGPAAIAGSPAANDWREQGVVILLAGNSSRSEFVQRALAEELGIPDLKVWRPGSGSAEPEAFQQVVLYETPPRTERGVSIVGVTPKTAVALGALKIANREVHLVRRTQGFSYFLGDMRGFPPKFTALVPMGQKTADPEHFDHYIEIGRWDSKMPLRVCKEYVPGRMTSSDPRIILVPTGLPMGAVGKLYVCVVSPEEIALYLHREGHDPLRTTINLAKHMR